MNRIEQKFKELRRQGRKAFVVFITAGYPNLEITYKLILEFSRIGVDIIELGVPFSDPMADGALIQESSQVALGNKINLNHILGLVKRARRITQIPICVMTYYNPIFCFGEERFVEAASGCGIDAVIVPDLPPEEGISLIRRSSKHDLDVICFISPTTSRERIKKICAVSRGFIYYVSLTGVTGPRQKLPADLVNNIRLIKRYARLPVCVGFGVSTPEQVKKIHKVADGVIVGSAIVKKIKENRGKPDLIKRVSAFVRRLIRRGGSRRPLR